MMKMRPEDFKKTIRELESVRMGPKPSGRKWLRAVAVKLPDDAIEMIDRAAIKGGRSDYIRKAIAAQLERDFGPSRRLAQARGSDDAARIRGR